MWPFAGAVAEVEPPETDEDKLAAAEREAIFAEGAYDMAGGTLRGFNIQHEQNRFAFTNGDVTYIQTMAADAERKFLEKDVRTALERRNRAWAARAEMLRVTGKIR